MFDSPVLLWYLSRVLFLRVSVAWIAREYSDDGLDDAIRTWLIKSMAGMIVARLGML
jgi:hypothetical protein